jgi:hypothetical protein
MERNLAARQYFFIGLDLYYHMGLLQNSKLLHGNNSIPVLISKNLHSILAQVSIQAPMSACSSLYPSFFDAPLPPVVLNEKG